MDKHKTTTYLLRQVPSELWQAAKHRAVDEGITLRQLIFRAVAAYIGKPETDTTSRIPISPNCKVSHQGILYEDE